MTLIKSVLLARFQSSPRSNKDVIRLIQEYKAVLLIAWSISFGAFAQGGLEWQSGDALSLSGYALESPFWIKQEASKVVTDATGVVEYNVKYLRGVPLAARGLDARV